MVDQEPFESLKRRAWETFRERWEEFKPRRLQILEELRRRAGGDVEDSVLVEQSWRDCVAEFERPAVVAEDLQTSGGELLEDPAAEDLGESLDDVEALYSSISRKRKKPELAEAVEWAMDQSAMYKLYRQQGQAGERGAARIRKKAPNGMALTMLEFSVSNTSGFMTLVSKTIGQKDEAAEERDRVLAEDARDQFAVIEVLEAEFAK